MAKVILRQAAIDDLNDIWDYTFERWSENQADKYYTILKLACKEIGVFQYCAYNSQSMKDK